MTYLAERVENMVEVNKNLSLCHFCDVVHSLTRIVANPGILIRKARKHWWHYDIEVSR
jgi:hypothetical protein